MHALQASQMQPARTPNPERQARARTLILTRTGTPALILPLLLSQTGQICPYSYTQANQICPS